MATPSSVLPPLPQARRFAATLSRDETDGAPVRPGPAAMVAAPVPPAGAPASIALGEVTRRHLAAVLEQQQRALLLAVIETSGGDPARPWRLVLAEVVLVPETQTAGP